MTKEQKERIALSGQMSLYGHSNTERICEAGIVKLTEGLTRIQESRGLSDIDRAAQGFSKLMQEAPA